MFKFNNTHIFTGYLKQLLSSFHLPKCRIYTKEQKQYAENYNKNFIKRQEILKDLNARKLEINDDLLTIENNLLDTNITDEYKDFLNNSKNQLKTELSNIEKEIILNTLDPELYIIQTNYHSAYEIYPNSLIEDLPINLDYTPTMRYVPYIKDGILQEYTEGQWKPCHIYFEDSEHIKTHKNKTTALEPIRYFYGQKILNYTKNLKIQNTVYDTYTHEYLGDYLRFQRDYNNINLMPLYNCFSNRACPHLDLEFEIGNKYKVKFKTDQSFETTLYKYYMVPVKFFKDYTIAIDSAAGIELCCCVYDEYHNNDTDFSNISKLTYQCFGDLQFKTPVLYSKLQNLNSTILDPNSDLCQYEDNLKLILKIPANNNSSIVILEGDYTRYNDCITRVANNNTVLTKRNKTVINYENPDVCEFLTDKLITPLQLLRVNTGESYPFADRLVEYLVGNTITVNETILDNVKRAKTVIGYNCNPNIAPIEASDGIWEPILQCLVYDYMNEKQNVNDINHDILGFIDKDVEKWYSVKEFKKDKNENILIDPKTNQPIVLNVETIANIDIYKD